MEFPEVFKNSDPVDGFIKFISSSATELNIIPSAHGKTYDPVKAPNIFLIKVSRAFAIHYIKCSKAFTTILSERITSICELNVGADSDE